MDYDKEFYEKEFTAGANNRTTICRGDLESLPCPFCTENVSDATMLCIVGDIDTEMDKWYEWRDNGDITEDRCNEHWWEVMERVVIDYGVPYYEDLDEE